MDAVTTYECKKIRPAIIPFYYVGRIGEILRRVCDAADVQASGKTDGEPVC
jgi:hypothetical protein